MPPSPDNSSSTATTAPINVPPTLTPEAVREAIARVCQEVNAPQDHDASSWKFEPATLESLCAKAPERSGPSTVDTNLLYGIERTSRNINDKTAVGQLCTFYFAYSTWEGRVIFWDFTDESPDATAPLWSRLLARIGVALHCRRLVWTHRDALPWYGPVPPETLDGWLTLHWKLPAMQAYSLYKDESNVSDGLPSSSKEAFSKALQQATHERFRLRLATEADIDIIDRLVMGLAEFENEPESYILSKEQLLHDGFGSDHPMYYCILVDDMANNGDDDSDDAPYTCAMAFCYVGYHLTEGRFLYLEDLFFEKPYRGKGGGKLVMSTLALVAQSLQCTKAVWQALDWNTPAL